MAQPAPLARERNLILAALLALAAAAWGLLAWRQGGMDEEMMGPTMGMGAPLFMAIWALMMVAMMFPTAAPMVLTFAAVQTGRRQRGQPYVPTWLFVSSYLALWVAFGAAAYGLAVAGERLAIGWDWLETNAPRLGGGVLVLAGLYQLTPLKWACLRRCRSPLSFVLGSWREGGWGAVRMGLEHGAYCLGCCWLLFVILFPLGVMNVAIMALITALIFAEKSLPLGPQVRILAAVALIAYGVAVVLYPDALPTML